MSFSDIIAGALQWAYTTFGFRERTDVSGVSVAVVKPTAPNKTMALDIVPGEGAVPNSDSGYAWVDVCSIDPIDHPTAPIFCARVGVKDSVVEFGSRSFNGAGVRAVHIILDRTVAMRLELDSAGKPLITCYGEVRAKNFTLI